MTHSIYKVLLFILCSLPFLLLSLGAARDTLGVDPVETLTHETGEWTLSLLLITLAITPLRIITGYSRLLKFRRMLGLFAFFYACLHLITYLWLDQFFDWMEILRDLPKRPFITVGVLAFLLMIPLAVTSNQAMMQRLGRNWKRLHRLVYLIPLLGVLHFLCIVKADTLEPLVYFVLLLVLLAFRAVHARKKTGSSQSRSS